MFETLLVAGLITRPNPVIELKEIEPETKIVQVEKPKELTIQEKIDSNYFNCDEAIEYIRADTAECLAKPTPSPVRTQTPRVQPQNAPQGVSKASNGWYDWGWCTYYVSTRRSVGQWNNASEWYWQAKRDGWSVGLEPREGAIAQSGNHVAYVEGIKGDLVLLSEMNYEGFGVISQRTAPASNFRYIY